MVKRLPNWLKIGVQAGFGPNFTMEFEAEIPKKIGLAYWTALRGNPDCLATLNADKITQYPPRSDKSNNMGKVGSTKAMV